ncbi:hypothetical protein GDO78_018805 [Eleutherodactylus coqui]|uniref:Uncharacterized protein n=1 Tax=Eleutherodactylus coqui TaxID=57060 RepID=A0A8J6BDA2_ELECQ|nr:hypothetical protein GDO78_018805 [Eleutherodactylus coqui]
MYALCYLSLHPGLRLGNDRRTSYSHDASPRWMQQGGRLRRYIWPTEPQELRVDRRTHGVCVSGCCRLQNTYMRFVATRQNHATRVKKAMSGSANVCNKQNILGATNRQS